MPLGRKKKAEEIQNVAPEAVRHELAEQVHEALHAAGIPHTHDHVHEDEHDHEHEGGHTHEHSHGHTHSHEHTRSVLNRMSRAIGHLQYVRKMVEEGRDCSEVLIQLAAVQSALLEGEDMNTTAFNQNPVGTGRFKFVEWDTTGGMIILERNADYYDKAPNIERVVYKTVSVESTKAIMLQSGEADLAWLNANYAAQFDGVEGYKSWMFTTADYRGASMAMNSDFWAENADSIGVLNYAIDKDVVVASVLHGEGYRAYSPIQLNPLGSNAAADIYPYDLDRFAEEMAKLGWEKGDDGIYVRNGQRFHFTIQTRDYEEERVDIANVMSNMLRQAGVEMEVVLVTKFDWQAGYNGFLAGYATQFDPDMAYAQFTTNGSRAWG